MKRKMYLLFVFIIMFSFLHSQAIRIFYNYQFRSDSLHREKQNNELLVLDIIPEKGSTFYSYKKYQQDSLFSDIRMKSETNFISIEKDFNAKVKFYVTKAYPDFTSVLYTNIGSTAVNLKNKEIFKWNVLPINDTINGYPVQKATLEFQGRQWAAWFTSEIQIQDGPYRFYGLPGLILKMEDQKGDHIFTFNAIKKINSDAKNTVTPSKSKSISVDEDQFKKIWKDYKKDPAKDYRLRYSGGGNLNIGGQIVSKNEIVKKYEAIAKEKIKEENNFIELKMYN